MYCVKCKSHTETKNQKKRQSKNGRTMLSGVCSKCGTKKSQFVSSSSTNKKGGMYNKDNKQEIPDIEEKPVKPSKKRKGGDF